MRTLYIQGAAGADIGGYIFQAGKRTCKSIEEENVILSQTGIPIYDEAGNLLNPIKKTISRSKSDGREKARRKSKAES